MSTGKFETEAQAAQEARTGPRRRTRDESRNLYARTAKRGLTGALADVGFAYSNARWKDALAILAEILIQAVASLSG